MLVCSIYKGEMQKQKFKQTEIGMIPEDWEVKPIKEFVKINELTINKNFQFNDIEYIDIDSVDNGIIKNSQSLKLKDAPSRAKRIVRKNDVIISTVRPNLKHFAFIKEAKPNTIVSTGFAVISSKHIDPKFLYYFITTDKYTNYLTAIADSHTSTYPSFNPDVIENSLLSYPNEDEQSAIAKILSDLDSKIELNQQMNKILEAIGQAIFKHWFIDFEFPNEKGKPYKNSGGEMVDSELGKIPKWWEVNELGEFIEFVKGRKPNQVFGNDEDGLMPQILIDVLDGGTPFFSNSENMVQSDETDIIMVMDGASSGRTERGFAGILGSTLAKIKVKELNQDYVYCLLKIKEDDIKQNTTGTSIPHADKKKIEKYLIAVPPKKILEDFRINFNQILFRQILIRKENKNLSQIRDSLLPKLMSGKIRVYNEK